jgi:L-ribulose-5-phosphate 3-epimerase UlaE
MATIIDKKVHSRADKQYYKKGKEYYVGQRIRLLKNGSDPEAYEVLKNIMDDDLESAIHDIENQISSIQGYFDVFVSVFNVGEYGENTDIEISVGKKQFIISEEGIK